MKTIQIVAVIVALALVATGVAIIVGSDILGNNSDKKVTVTQSDGTEKEVKYQPQRIVCLSTYTCEFLLIYGYADKVVGVSNSTYTNPDLKYAFGPGKATDCGSFSKPNISTIVELQPDLVIAYPGYPDVTKALDDVKISYVELKCADLTTIPTEAMSVAKIVGREDLGQKYVDFLNAKTTEVTQKVAQKAVKDRTYMESFSANYASGPSSAYYTLAVAAGCDMVYSGASGTVSPSAIIEWNPEVILKTPTLVSMEGVKAKTIYDEIKGRTGFDTITAVQNDDIYLICSQLFSGPRCFGGMLAVYESLYPGELSKDWKSALDEYNSMFGVNMSTSGLYYTEHASA